MRSFAEQALAQRGAVSASTAAIVVFSPAPCDTSSSSACATRAPSAATASSASSPLISMVGIALGVCGADRGAVGDERLPEGGAHAHPRRRLARADHRPTTTASTDWQAVAKIAAQHPRVRRRRAVRAGAGDARRRPGGARRAGARHPARAEEDKVADLAQPHARRLARRAASRASSASCSARTSRARSACCRGDKVALIAPQGMVTPAGVIPRLKQFTVVGIFEAGISDADSGLALIHLEDAQTLYQLGEPVTRRAPQARRPVRRAHGGARAAGEAAARRCTPPTGRAATPTSSARWRSRSA